MTRRTLLPLLFALLLPPTLGAATIDRDPSNRPQGRHFILESAGVLDAETRARLDAAGVDLQRPLGGDRYLVRLRTDEALPEAESVGSMHPFDGSHKIARSAWSEVARPKAFARLTVLFHDDVTFEDAVAAIETAGGVLESPMTMGFHTLRRIEARVPGSALETLAADERVFGLFGPPRRPRALNAQAAVLSNVTPLFSAPYNLDGSGVVLSLFELAAADNTSPQFGGRYKVPFTGGTSSDRLHATHVAGTMIASGLDPSPPFATDPARAKGMAPAATLQEFNVLVDFAVMIDAKKNQLPPLGSVADNNSWDYSLGWQPAGANWVWNTGEDYLGGYSLTESSPYDAVAVSAGVPLLVHSAGNDGTNGHPALNAPWDPHHHVDQQGEEITTETYCYSQNGTGTDCPAPTCSVGKSTKTGDNFCEVTKHPTYGPYGTVGLMSSAKNTVSVGAVDVRGVSAYFSSRGPARDGRIKPELVAKGVNQFSTAPVGSYYTTLSGTSMAAPVVTGLSALVVQQYRKTFSGQTPDAPTLKTLLIAGADDLVGPADLDTPGPDYTYGFGLADAKATVDLILADNGTGSRIKRGTVALGQQIEFPLTIPASQKVRVVLGWFDPEIYPAADDPAQPALLNDLDLKVIDPSGNEILPYVLDPSQPSLPAKRGVNTRDTTEEVEISNAAPGNYKVIVSGTRIRDTKKATQDFVVVANAPLTPPAVCTDPFEPNDSTLTATLLPSGSALTAGFCQSGDLDFYRFTAVSGASVRLGVTATTTPVKATLVSGGVEIASKTVAAGTSGSLVSTVPVVGSVPGPVAMILKLEPAGTIVPPATYSLTVSYLIPSRRHAVAK